MLLPVISRRFKYFTLNKYFKILPLSEPPSPSDSNDKSDKSLWETPESDSSMIATRKEPNYNYICIQLSIGQVTVSPIPTKKKKAWVSGQLIGSAPMLEDPLGSKPGQVKTQRP